MTQPKPLCLNLNNDMVVVVPYVSEMLHWATRVYLRKFEPTERVRLVDKANGYIKLMIRLWEEGNAFIIVEQDVVPWWGAIPQLKDCPEDWCAFGYEDEELGNGSAGFGCIKFGEKLIKELPTVWQDKQDFRWRNIDTYFFGYAMERGWKVHQHYPSVIHLPKDPSVTR